MFCILIRFLISSAMDSDRENPAFVQRHIRVCPCCRRFHDQSHSLAHRLIADAPEACQTADFAITAAPVPIRSIPLALAAALMCLTLAGLFCLQGTRAPGKPENSQRLVEELSQLALRTTELLPDDPLAREITYVAEDTMAAVDAMIACTGLDPAPLVLALNAF